MKKRISIAVLAIIFIGIAFVVFGMDSTVIDDRGDSAIQSLRSDTLTPIVKVATDAGSKLVLIPLALIATLWLLIRYRAIAKTTFLLASLLVSHGLNIILKNSFERPRPEAANRLVEEASYSFPSGHVMASTGFYGFAFFLIWRYFQERNRQGWAAITVVIAAVWLLLTGLFRVYLGIHHTTDIIAGYAASGIVLLLSITLYDRYRKKV